MIPSPFLSNMYFPIFDQAYIQNAYQNMMNFNMMSSMMLYSQEQALQAQFHSVMQMKSQLLQSTLTTPKIHIKSSELISPSMKTPLSFPVQVKDTQAKERNITPKSDSPLIEQPAKTKKPREKKLKTRERKRAPEVTKEQLEKMIYELLDKIGRVDRKEIEKLRQKYASSGKLLPIFDSIVAKYLPVKKHREDVIRYIIRKALKFLKSDIIKKDKVYGKRAYAILCKKYFSFSSEDLEKAGVDTKDEKELTEVLLPYRKSSKNRTMNTSFTAEIFSSREFCEDYAKFLEVFDNVLDEDNNKKVQKLIVLAEECMTKNCADKIRKCTRLPWLNVWVEKTKHVALELPRNGVEEEREEAEDEGEEQEEDSEEEESRKKTKTEYVSESSCELYLETSTVEEDI